MSRPLAIAGIVALTAASFALAAAEPTLVATSNTGARIELMPDAGPCINGAKSAAWVSADATVRVPGCWRLAGAAVEIAFLDGDALRVPAGAFKAPDVL